MTIGDLIFLACGLGFVLAVGWAAISWSRGRVAVARRVGRRLAACVVVYAIALLGVSLLSPRKVVALGTPRCIDDWCVAVTSAAPEDVIGGTRARRIFIVVQLHVTSRALRVTQRELGLRGYLVDDHGRRFELSSGGEAALQRAGRAGPPLDTRIAPGKGFDTRLAFDVPLTATGLSFVATHFWFPGALIIGGDESLLHRRPIVPLTPSAPARGKG